MITICNICDYPIFNDEGFIITDEKKTVITKKTQPFCFEISKLKYSLTSNLFISTDNSPFILILGKSTSSLSAFIFDGSFGVEIYPETWFQYPFICYHGYNRFCHKKNIVEIYTEHDFTHENKILYLEYA